MTTISIREFKAKASEILRKLEKEGGEVIITRHGKPCAKLTPIEGQQKKKKSLAELRGMMKHWPDLEYEDFLEVKKIWEPRMDNLND